jgi:hypothetical protein
MDNQESPLPTLYSSHNNANLLTNSTHSLVKSSVFWDMMPHSLLKVN